MFPFLLGQQGHTPETSPNTSGRRAHEENRTVPLDVMGFTGAEILTEDLPCAGRTP